MNRMLYTISPVADKRNSVQFMKFWFQLHEQHITEDHIIKVAIPNGLI